MTKLDTLTQMGFDVEQARAALEAMDQDLDRSIQLLMGEITLPAQPAERPRGTRVPPGVDEIAFVSLLSMGYDEETAGAALRRCSNDLDRAIDFIINPPRTSLPRPEPMDTSPGEEKKDPAFDELPIAPPPVSRDKQLSEIGKRLFLDANMIHSRPSSQDQKFQAGTSTSAQEAAAAMRAAAAQRRQDQAAALLKPGGGGGGRSGSEPPPAPAPAAPEYSQDQERQITQKVQEMKRDPFYNGWGDSALKRLAVKKLKIRPPQQQQESKGPSRKAWEAALAARPAAAAALRRAAPTPGGGAAVAAAAAAAAAQQEDQGFEDYKVMVKGGITIRQEPGLNSNIVMKVREGDIVTAARVDAKYLSHPLVQQGRRIKVVSPAEGYVTAYSRNNQPFLKTTSGSTFQPGQRRSSNSLPDQGSLPLQHGMSQASNEALAMYSAINGQSTAQAQVARVLKMISSTASQGFINTEEKAELKARLIQGESVQVIENTLQQKIQHAQHQQASAPLASFTAERMAQDDEYLEALRQDRLKAEQRKKAEAERQLELEKQQIEKERAERLASEYKKRIGVLRARFANETHLSSPDCKRVRIVMPSGKKVQRQFHASDTVQDLHDFVEVWFFDNQETVKDFELVTSFPRVVLDQYRQTLEQQGFGPSTILYVHDLMA